MKSEVFFALLAPLFLGACAYSVKQVAEPSTITLDDGVTQVANSLYHLQQLTADRDKSGLIPDEASVTFNVSAKATSANSGTLNIANVPLSAGTIGGSLSSSLNDESNRGNVITIKFKNLATADLTKGALAKGSKINLSCLYADYRKTHAAECKKLPPNLILKEGLDNKKLDKKIQ